MCGQSSFLISANSSLSSSTPVYEDVVTSAGISLQETLSFP